MRHILFRRKPGRNALSVVLLSTWVFVSHSAPGLAVVPQSERDALIAIYNSMGGAGWTNKTGWLDDSGTECTWYGVTCDAAQTTVTGLDLSNNNLNGTIPAAVGNLVSLQVLDLSSPYLTGSLPSQLGTLKQLRSLRLKTSLGGTYGRLTGIIPPELGNLTNLEILDLSQNGFSGNIPVELGNLTNLRVLNISGGVARRLTGNIPAELGNLANLETLVLSFNHLTGSIPPSLGNLSALTYLDLYSNELSGAIPSALGRLSALKHLDLSGNQLNGIPDALGDLSNLTDLSLNGNALTGSIPAALGKLTGLRHLTLSANQLSGVIPAALGNASSLESLDLRQNLLTGIPDTLGNLSILTYLDISVNKLSGSIPPTLGNLSSLTYLDLSRNQLSSISAGLGNLSSLVTLYLNDNQLSGSIPASLGNLSKLRDLVLSANQLSGSIPDALGNLPSLNSLVLSGNQLDGSIPDALGNLGRLNNLVLSGNQLSGNIPAFLGNLSGLVRLDLGGNQLSGGIPPSLGDLSSLQFLALSGNHLTGSIPDALLSLSNLNFLSLSGNELSGSIPAGLGNLKQLQALHLSRNQLTGSIPPTLGKLSLLASLLLDGNKLSGEIPSELSEMCLRVYPPLSLDIGYNALYTSYGTVKWCIDRRQSGWNQTQTVAPSGTSVRPSSNASVVLSWDPIPFTDYGGRYEAWLCDADGKPAVLLGTTSDKESSSLAVNNFYPGKTYNLALRTVSDPNTFNLNTVTSDFSPAISLNVPGNVSSMEFRLNGTGAVMATTVGGTGATQAGYAEAVVQSGSTPYATALFSYRQNGVVVSEAGVSPSVPTRSARCFVDYRSDATLPGSDTKVEIYTGFAMVNHGGGPASVSFILRDPAGQVIGRGIRSLDKDAHLAAYFHQLPDIVPGFSIDPSFAASTHFGTLELSSDQPLSILALRFTVNQRGEMLMTTTPTADLTRPSGTPFGGLPSYLPQLADGAGYSTTAVLLNTSTAVETGVLRVYRTDGSPLTVRQVNGFSASSFSYSIPAGGLYVLQTDASPHDAQAGWVEVTPDPGMMTPTAAGILHAVQDDVLITETGIPSAAPTAHARIFVDTTGGHNTGIAIVNPTIGRLNVLLQAFEMDGTTPAGVVKRPIALDGKGRTASFADELISDLPSGFQGVLDISGDTPFAAITYRLLVNERDEVLLTAFPVADLSQPPPSPILFPQIADGDGFVTQFVLLNPSGPSSTTLSFFGETGTPLPVGKW